MSPRLNPEPARRHKIFLRVRIVPIRRFRRRPMIQMIPVRGQKPTRFGRAVSRPIPARTAREKTCALQTDLRSVLLRHRRQCHQKNHTPEKNECSPHKKMLLRVLLLCTARSYPESWPENIQRHVPSQQVDLNLWDARALRRRCISKPRVLSSRVKFWKTV